MTDRAGAQRTPVVVSSGPPAGDRLLAESLASDAASDLRAPASSKWYRPAWLFQTVEDEKSRRERLRLLPVAIFCGAVVIIALALGLGLGLGLKKHRRPTGPVVDLGYAKYEGSQVGSFTNQFLGLRFARPPTGDLRWRAPASPETEREIQSARELKPICLADLTDPEQISTSYMDEDCLFANVWAPAYATPDTKLPVLVFIQGGGFQQNADANWNGTYLVEASGQTLVFVNFNYRVGIWGFLGGKDVQENGVLNAGLLDQRFLLKWVQENISKFGGDPNHVVIQGVSAGAGSVALHLAAYGGRNDSLFVGGIAESPFHPSYPKISDQEEQLRRVKTALACTGDDDSIDCLRRQDMASIQKANILEPFLGHQGVAEFYWTPCIDGDIIQDLPYHAFREGKILKVPLLFGTCTNEGSVFAPNARNESEIENFLMNNYPKLNETVAKNITKMYPKQTPVPLHNPWFPSASQAYGEATFICPSNIFLNLASKAYGSASTAPLWSYRFNVLDPGDEAAGLGVRHAAEARAVFESDPARRSSWSTINAPIIPIVMHYWISFARVLDPNVYKYTQFAPQWEQWGDSQQRLLLQAGKTGLSKMETVDQGEQERCAVWENIAPSIDQ